MRRRAYGRTRQNAAHPTLLRSGGVGTLLAGVLFVAWGYLDQTNAPPYFYTLAHALSLIVPALFAVGMVALYASVARRTAWPVKVGIFLSLIASALGLAQGLFSVPATSTYMYYALWWFPAVLPPSVWIAVLPTGLLLAGVGTV